MPSFVKRAEVFCGGCLVVEAEPYDAEREKAAPLVKKIAECGAFDRFQVVVIHDSVEFARATDKFLWATWTRFNPATDVRAKSLSVENHHLSYENPIVIDARMKPWYPSEVEARPDIAARVERRWREYFPHD